MLKKYIPPKMEVSEFDAENILTTSGIALKDSIGEEEVIEENITTVSGLDFFF